MAIKKLISILLCVTLILPFTVNSFAGFRVSINGVWATSLDWDRDAAVFKGLKDGFEVFEITAGNYEFICK